MIGCNITHRGKTIVCGKKCKTTGLWMIPITQKTPTNLPPTTIPASINQTAKYKLVSLRNGIENIIDEGIKNNNTPSPNLLLTTREIAANTIQTSTKEELAQFYHQCLLSPPKPTLLQGTDNQPFKTFPGLTYELISKHLPPSTATDKGHMKRRAKIKRGA